MSLDTTTLADADSTVVTLYHCASMHGTYEQQRATMDRLDSLADTELVDDVHYRAWAHQLSPNAEDDWCQKARATYARFRAWATENDRSLEPAFGTRTTSSIVDDEEYEVIEFPVLCVAVTVDDELVHVAPSTDPVTGSTYTVGECLDALEATALAPRASARSHS
jgi:hypothetical protein